VTDPTWDTAIDNAKTSANATVADRPASGHHDGAVRIERRPVVVLSLVGAAGAELGDHAVEPARIFALEQQGENDSGADHLVEGKLVVRDELELETEELGEALDPGHRQHDEVRVVDIRVFDVDRQESVFGTEGNRTSLSRLLVPDCRAPEPVSRRSDVFDLRRAAT
jgi:hypothetical protein